MCQEKGLRYVFHGFLVEVTRDRSIGEFLTVRFWSVFLVFGALCVVKCYGVLVRNTDLF